jgi:hypothetical protein
MRVFEKMDWTDLNATSAAVQSALAWSRALPLPILEESSSSSRCVVL